MYKSTLLVVDDEEDSRDAIQILLDNSFYVVKADSVVNAIEMAKQNPPDVILADLHMPGGDGISLCKAIRQNPDLKNVPILVISACEDEQKRTECFLWGADDFVAKPFSGAELIARIMAKLRWSRQPKETATEEIVCGNLQVNERKFEAALAGQRVDLTLFEFKLLKYFVEHKDVVLSRTKILQEVWENGKVSDRTVDVHVCSLRNKLKDFDFEFHTVHGAGYILRKK